MRVRFRCPACEAPNAAEVPDDGPADVRCAACEWSAGERAAGSGCVVCGCNDLWRQKDFPQGLGLLFVACGAIFSTVAWAYHEPVWAIGILLAFAAIDLFLFAAMPDVLVCYRCSARHAGVAARDDPAYDHELGERYRQEAIRTRDESEG